VVINRKRAIAVAFVNFVVKFIFLSPLGLLQSSEKASQKIG
jgi:hypothetical protein